MVLKKLLPHLATRALTPQGIEGAMKHDVSKHWCTLQWCASRGWFIAHENWTSCRGCSNYIWVINNLIAYKVVSYIRALMVYGFICQWDMFLCQCLWLPALVYHEYCMNDPNQYKNIQVLLSKIAPFCMYSALKNFSTKALQSVTYCLYVLWIISLHAVGQFWSVNIHLHNIVSVCIVYHRFWCEMDKYLKLIVLRIV